MQGGEGADDQQHSHIHCFLLRKSRIYFPDQAYLSSAPSDNRCDIEADAFCVASTKEEIMKHRTLSLSLGVVAMAGIAFAQAPEAPKPGPEHKALGYFAGKWTSEGEMKPGPYGPGGKMTSQDTCEWFSGGFQLVCRSQGKGPMGPMTSMGVLAYNPQDKAYTYYGIDSMGTSELAKGAKSGKTWTFTSKSYMEGQAFNSRYTIVETSPTSYTFKWDTSSDGTKWSTMMEGTTTKSST
jgi:hypothetical protein